MLLQEPAKGRLNTASRPETDSRRMTIAIRIYPDATPMKILGDCVEPRRKVIGRRLLLDQDEVFRCGETREESRTGEARLSRGLVNRRRDIEFFAVRRESLGQLACGGLCRALHRGRERWRLDAERPFERFSLI